jgi:hypothetical protein
MIAPRLVSLWEMLYPYVYFLGSWMARCSWLEDFFTHASAKDPTATLGAMHGTVHGDAGMMMGYAKLMGLDSASAQAERIRDKVSADTFMSEAATWIKDLRMRALDQLQAREFLHVSPADVAYYSSPLSGWGEVPDKFPSTRYDLEEAGKCLALGRSTASVYHLMRVMERGLSSLARIFGIPYAPSWKAYLSQIDTRIAAQWNQKDPDWKRLEPFFRDAAGMLVAVRVAWRNPTMHVAAKYTPEEAEDIYRAVRGFMAHVATEVDESSQKASWA